MPKQRANRSEQLELAFEDLFRAAHRAPGVGYQRRGDRVYFLRRGEEAEAPVFAFEYVDAGEARDLIASEPMGALVVADRISSGAKDVFERTGKGWGWLDRRTGLALRFWDEPVDEDPVPDGEPVPDPLGVPSTDGPIRGRAGVGLAAVLLRVASDARPSAPPSIREVAALIGMSSSVVGDASKRLREAGLVLADGTPQLPELFEALAAAWKPTFSTPVARLPEVGTAIGSSDLDELGWAVGGDEAAIAWGAPMVAVNPRRVFWIPTLVEAKRLARDLGPAASDSRVATVAVPPTVLVCRGRRHVPSSDWPTPHPLYLALDLAQDPGRGREILADWHPTGVTRVW